MKTRFWLWITIGPLLLGGLIFLFFNDPQNSHWLPQCTFQKLTGLNCPGCGSTRAIYALLHGNIAGALGANPLLFPMLGIIAFLVWKPRYCHDPRVSYSILALLLFYWILRNLPFFPFSMLAPH